MNDSSVPDRTSLSVDTSAPCSDFAWRPLPGLRGQGIPADPWNSDRVTLIVSGCKSGHGGCGAGGTINLPYTSTVLKEIRG